MTRPGKDLLAVGSQKSTPPGSTITASLIIAQMYRDVRTRFWVIQFVRFEEHFVVEVPTLGLY